MRPRYDLGPDGRQMEITIVSPGRPVAEWVVDRLVVIDKKTDQKDGMTTISALSGHPDDGPQEQVVLELDQSGKGTMYEF